MTRAHARFALAYVRLVATNVGAPRDLGRWMRVRWGIENIDELSGAQARHGARQMNAWRYAERRSRQQAA